MKTLHIETLEGAELQPYRTLRRPLEHQRRGIFVAEGKKVVLKLLESDLETISVLLTPEWFDMYKSLLEQRKENPTVFVAPRMLIESIVGFNLHQSIMAVAKIPRPATLEQILADNAEPYLFCAIDGLTNAENLGVLVRNCAAFGVQAILVGETSSSPYLRRAVRNSMGTVFQLPVVHLTNLAQTLNELRSAHGIHSIAAHPHTDKKTIAQVDFTASCCIVLGSEGEGVSSAVLETCDDMVAIPMKEGVDSLNVASASAVFLYEVQRQRRR
ncbi:MAG: RNA methyltransferase [Ignavibacteriales bacterium]|nr:RNA methyltransferase [Ignavibacteriales bacterium]MBI3788796.1 RNA methyltransferase [Ignavibacteriales bacterium]